MTPAVRLFSANWFSRHEDVPPLTDVETDLINAALGPAPQRWDGESDVARLAAIVAEHPLACDRIGARLLKVAVGMRGCGGAVRFLLERDVALDAEATVYNVLHEAAWAGATDTLQAVFESGASDATPVSVKKPHTGWPDNVSLMYWAAWGGYPELARLLIEYGAGVHHELRIKGNGERGTTSLHEAVAPSPWAGDNALRSGPGKLEVARILIDDGAEYDICTACALDDVDRATALVDGHPANANVAYDYGMRPLHWAARAGSFACVSMLLASGADVNAVNTARRTPLQLAAEHDRADVIRALAANGAELDTQDRKGRTPLHRATYEGKVAAAEALLAVGADPSVPNKSGKNAFEIARKDTKYLKARA